MRAAILSRVDPEEKVFTYVLTHPFHVYHGKMTKESYYAASIFDVTTQGGSTQIRYTEGEVMALPGVYNHATLLEGLGYIRAVGMGHVKSLSDREVIACLDEFRRSGDDLEPFLADLERRWWTW